MNRWRIFIVLSLMLAFVFSAQVVVPQDNPHPNAPSTHKLIEEELLKEWGSRPGDPFANGKRERPSRPEPSSTEVIAYSGGPDAFGYTFDTGLPFDWTDATQGYRTNITGDDNYGYISLGFEFPYYENDWSTAAVSTNGFLSFGGGSSGCCGHYPLPLPLYPNSIIAPYWADLEIEPAEGGGIWVLRGGQAPNRYVVIEWHSASIYYYGGQITFAVKLKENGDIIMSYTGMDDQDGGSIGIEDSTGYVGIEYDTWAWVDNYSTFGFYPPAPKRGALAFNPRQGELIAAGTTQKTPVNVRNYGRLGTDTIDIDLSSNWAAQVTWPDGSALTDTNSNGLPDTGPLYQGGTAAVTVVVTAPAGTAVGASNKAILLAASGADPNQTSTAIVESTVPAPHAQAIIEDHEGRAMGLNLLQQKGQRKTFASEMYRGGYAPAIAETADNGYAYVWYRSWPTAPNYEKYTGRLFIAITDKFGDLKRNVQTPFDPRGAVSGVVPTSAYDWDAALAVAPNGRIGLVWVRYLYNRSAGYNRNIFFALLDQQGNVINGPVDITNWSGWGRYGDPDYRYLTPPQIAATEDGRFVMTWESSGESSGGDYLRSVFYAVAGNDGVVQRAATPITELDPDVWSIRPTVSTAPNNQAVLFYTYDYCPDEDNCDDYFAYSVIDAKNNISTKHAELASYGYYQSIDSTLLSDNRTIVVWSNYNGLRYAILTPQLTVDGSSGRLNDPLARHGMYSPSIAPASGGKAVVTWRDGYSLNISYALLNSAGEILTEPALAYQGRSQFPSVNSGYNGSGTASYSWLPSAAADAAVNFVLNPVGGMAGNTASIPISVANVGQAKATGVELTVTLPSGLTYAGDDSGLAPTIDGSKISWNLPDLALLEGFKFNVLAEIPPTADLGKRYNVNAAVTISGSDAGSGNNTATTKVMVSRQALLPIILRP